MAPKGLLTTKRYSSRRRGPPPVHTKRRPILLLDPWLISKPSLSPNTSQNKIFNSNPPWSICSLSLSLSLSL
jgi:hypothetical protein